MNRHLLKVGIAAALTCGISLALPGIGYAQEAVLTGYRCFVSAPNGIQRPFPDRKTAAFWHRPKPAADAVTNENPPGFTSG